MKRINIESLHAAALAAGAIGILPANAPLKHGEVAFANESRFTESYFSEPLTIYAVGWRDPNNIQATLDFVAPPVQVPRRFEYAEATNKEEFLTETDDLRSIGAEFKRVEYTGKKTNAKTDNRGLTMVVDLDEVADKANWRQEYTAKLLRRSLRNDLKTAITLLSAAATNNNKTWDVTAGKDPDMDVITDLVTAATASGVKPNRILYGDTAWAKRMLACRAQESAGGYASASMNESQLAGLLGVERVMVSRERYQSTASAKAEIVNNLVLEFLANDGADTEDPSNIKLFWSPVEGGGRVRVYEQQISAKLYQITVERYVKIAITSTLGIRKLTIS